MERIVKAISDLEQAFMDLYNVEVNIHLTIFDRDCQDEKQTIGKFVGGTFDITVHYPLEEYTEE